MKGMLMFWIEQKDLVLRANVERRDEGCVCVCGRMTWWSWGQFDRAYGDVLFSLGWRIC